MKTIIVTDLININTIAVLLQRNGPVECSTNRVFHEACLLLLHYYYTEEIKSSHDSHGVQLKADYLRKNIGKQPGTNNFYLTVIDALYHSSILTRDGVYLKGKYSMTYYLNQELDGIKHNYAPQTKIICNKIRSPKCDIHYQESCLKRLSYDFVGADNIQDKLYYTERKHKNYIWEQLQSQEYRVKVDDYGRVHTNLTRLSRIYRQFITFENQNLYSVDMNCAQPFLLSQLLLNKYLGDNYQQLPIDKTLIPIPVMDFIDDVATGRFYEKLAKSLNLEFTETANGVGNDYVFKTDFKINVIAIVFYGRFPIRRHKYLIKFAELYPEVYNFIMKNRKIDHTFLPKLLQSLESEIFNEAISSLEVSYPETVFLRLHDCIITTKEFTENAKTEISRITFNKIGILPKVKIDQFNVDSENVQERNPNSYLFQITDAYYLKKRYQKKLRKYPARLLDKIVNDDELNNYPDPDALGNFNYPAEYFKIMDNLNWEMNQLQSRYCTSSKYVQ